MFVISCLLCCLVEGLAPLGLFYRTSPAKPGAKVRKLLKIKQKKVFSQNFRAKGHLPAT